MDRVKSGRFPAGSSNSPTQIHSYACKVQARPGEPGTADTSFPMDRQDSLMLCQQLQEKDGGFDFMDENMDLTPYLKDLEFEGENNEDLEPIIDKQRLIESDIYMHHGNFPQSPPQYTDLSNSYEARELEPLGTDDFLAITPQMPQTPQMPHQNIALKTEAVWDEEPEESVPTTSTDKNKVEKIEIDFTPTIKPRKYSLKPEAEKRNPLYRLKREKNNDAVRKSRTKAKEQQRLKEEQIKGLQQRVADLEGIIREKDETISRLEAFSNEARKQNKEFNMENKKLKQQIAAIKRQCRCSLFV